MLGPSLSTIYELPIVLVSTLGAVAFTCVVICPFETARVRLMGTSIDLTLSPHREEKATTLAGSLAEMSKEDGPLGSLWSGLGPLLLREVLFSTPKVM